MILIPAAGAGTRFGKAGYSGPKHKIPLGGVPMIDRVIANCEKILPGHEVVVADRSMVGETRGATETILTALARTTARSSPLLIANCDQLIMAEPYESSEEDGAIYTFRSSNKSHSYVTTSHYRITDIVEKQVVSDRAVAGVYIFSDPEWVEDACSEVLRHTNGKESYFSSAISHMIDEGANFEALDVPVAILGTPEDFQRFEVALSLAS